MRQLPLFVSERMLKRLAMHAMRTFETEAKDGTRSPLTADELTEPAPEGADADGDVKMEDGESDADDDAAPKKGKQGKKFAGKGKGKGRDTGVRQAKIVRQQDRVDAVTGKGRSKGYGFLELGAHADALRVLRWANCNPAVGALFEAWWKQELEDLLAAEKRKGGEKMDEARVKRIREELERGAPPKARGTLIVEFSIENVQVVQRRAAKTGKDGKAEKDRKGGKEQKAVSGGALVDCRVSFLRLYLFRVRTRRLSAASLCPTSSVRRPTPSAPKRSVVYLILRSPTLNRRNPRSRRA